MPELPDVTVYVEALRRFIVGREIRDLQVRSPFLVRTFEPPVQVVVGKSVRRIKRLGKRIVWELDTDLFLVFHLMIAGRFHWKRPGAKSRAKTDLASFAFEHGVLMLTEASPKKRCALHLATTWQQVLQLDRGGLEVLECDEQSFRSALLRENHTLKRSLTDPRTFSGIGNAYSDEILHAARLSPLQQTKNLSDAEITRLFHAVRATLENWTERLRVETGNGFPEKVTAFRAGMAVHGRYQQPCPACGTEIQRVVYAENEMNYCPRCQTGGKLLADRSLSRLLKSDWPRTIDELEGGGA
jgi:formamidopyrimidine-DNA glycosylase